jgi:hypothetical protein
VAVTIALLIALSIGRPQLRPLTGRNQRTVIVLDTSPSMNARTADGRTRWRHAVEKAQALLDSREPAVEVRIADTSGESASPFTTDRAEALKQLEALSPAATAPRFPDVDGRHSTVYFVSDGVALTDAPAFVERLSVFEPAHNVAITAFEVRPVPSNPLEYEAYLEIQNSGAPSTVDVTLRGQGQESIRRTTRLAAEETLREAFDLSRFGGGAVQASVRADDDALASDDVAFAYLPLHRAMRTLLVTRGNRHLETLLKLDPHVVLLTTSPRNYRELPEIDAYIFDRFAPAAAPPKPALVIGAPAAPWLPAPQGHVRKPEISAWSDEHPTMQHLSIRDVSIQQASRIDPGGLTVIVASKETPLIVASETPRWVMLTFDLDSSDLPLQAGFPLFVGNTLAWLNREPLALGRPPGNVHIPMAQADVRASDGRAIPSEPLLDATVFHTNEPGLYTATHGDSRLHIAVSLANAHLSNINRSVFTAGTPTAAPPRGWWRRELWFYMLLTALVFISAEWLTYHRRITL